MGIDRIGKGGGLPQAPDAQGVKDAGAIKSTGAPTKTFEVDRSSPKQVDRTHETSGVDPSSPLGRLRAGEIDVNGYVDLKVEQATANLKGLSPTELADIKSALRDQLATDPGLVDLVKGATGQAPKLPEDG